jgi:hypothetical protein
MIVTCLIASIEDGKVHCEWYSDNFVRYEIVRRKIKQFLEEQSFMKENFEIVKMSDNLILHFSVEKGVIFIIVYEENYPKKLGKACLTEIKNEFEKFVKTQNGSNIDVYSYVATLKQSYSLLKFGNLKR